MDGVFSILLSFVDTVQEQGSLTRRHSVCYSRFAKYDIEIALRVQLGAKQYAYLFILATSRLKARKAWLEIRKSQGS